MRLGLHKIFGPLAPPCVPQYHARDMATQKPLVSSPLKTLPDSRRLQFEGASCSLGPEFDAAAICQQMVDVVHFAELGATTARGNTTKLRIHPLLPSSRCKEYGDDSLEASGLRHRETYQTSCPGKSDKSRYIRCRSMSHQLAYYGYLESAIA